MNSQSTSWIRRDNSCQSTDREDYKVCHEFFRTGRWDEAEEMDCCPPNHYCHMMGPLGSRGLCIPMNQKWEDIPLDKPIGSPFLFTSTRDRKTSRQPREALQDPYVSILNKEQGAYEWQTVSKEDLRKIHSDLLSIMNLKLKGGIS